MHKHFPVEYLPFLQYSVEQTFRNIVYKQMYKIAREVLGVKTSFFIDTTLNFRFHYPFQLEYKSKLRRDVYRCLKLENYYEADDEFKTALVESKNYRRDKSDITKVEYFGNVPASVYHHSPHRDTWFSHSTRGLNLWWAITDVDDKNGLVLYPDVSKYDLKHHKRPAYVLDRYRLGAPVMPRVKPGELLIFDPEILHSSRINTSTTTRIVFSGRINLRKPKFYAKAYDLKEPYWIKSQDLKKNRLDNVQLFPSRDNLSTETKQKILKEHKPEVIRIHTKLKKNKSYKVRKIENRYIERFVNQIEFEDAKLAFLKEGTKLYAFSALCPHFKFNLTNGYLFENNITCQGHGLMFNIRTGKSTCGAFKIETYKIVKKDKYYWLET